VEAAICIVCIALDTPSPLTCAIHPGSTVVKSFTAPPKTMLSQRVTPQVGWHMDALAPPINIQTWHAQSARQIIDVVGFWRVILCAHTVSARLSSSTPPDRAASHPPPLKPKTRPPPQRQHGPASRPCGWRPRRSTAGATACARAPRPTPSPCPSQSRSTAGTWT